MDHLDELWLILSREAVGHEAALSVESLACRLGWPERHVRAVVAALVTERGRPVGSSTGGRFRRTGYYVVVTSEERRRARAQLINRLRAIVARLRAFDRAMADRFARQLEIDFGDGEGIDTDRHRRTQIRSDLDPVPISVPQSESVSSSSPPTP